MLLKDIIEFKNGKKKPSSKGNIPIYGGNGILDYTDQNNQDGESLIIGRVGAYCGCVYSHYGKCWISDNARVGKVKEGNDFYYCYYLLKRLNLNSRHVGSGQPLMTQEILNNIEVNPCNHKIQQKIGRILKNIDDKIKKNNEINDNLLEISKALYKRWFIDFEFPDEDGQPYKSSGGKMIYSELGEIPCGWELGFIDDNKLTKIIKSGVQKYNGVKKYIATADVEGTVLKSSNLISFNNKPSRANMTPIPNSIWFAKMQDSIKNILVDEYMEDILNNYIFSTGFMGVECINNCTYYIWNFITSDKFNEIKSNLSTGTLMAGISNSTITGCKYLIPKKSILNCFEEKIKETNMKIYFNNKQNETLTQLRDTLLPKLMNGEINLENIEI